MASEIKGLPGLNYLSERERQAFMLSNEDKLKKYRKPGDRKRAADILYNNTLFKDTFGDDVFRQLNDGTEASYNLRNNMLTEKVATDAFSARFSPWDENGTKRNNHKGLGADYEKYFGRTNPTTGQRIGGLSAESLIKVLESDYLSPDGFENDWNSKSDALRGIEHSEDGKVKIDPWRNIGGFTQALSVSESTGEAAKQMAREKNNRILEHIYNDESEERAHALGNLVGKAYLDESIVGGNDDETISKFKQAITPDRATGNLGIPEYASHYGIVDGENISSEMKNFSIDDMRDVLAKKAVYDANLSPEMAMTALNNEAKRYIHDHQGFGKEAAMFGKDVAIASLSYTTDKVNGFYNLGLMAADGLSKAGMLDRPIVYVDDQGNVFSLDDTHIVHGEHGDVFLDESGDSHPVHPVQINRTTLHNMGKNVGVFDSAGSEDESILNPQDWTRREQFGVWDKDIAKQYEKIGSSPYKVAYNPNEDKDLMYEGFKMMSFGLADAGSQLIPFGIGAVGNTLSKASNLGKVIQGIGRVTNTASKYLTAETRAGQLIQGGAGALGIAEAYQRGAFQETLAQNMANLEQQVLDMSTNEVRSQYANDEAYKKQIDLLVDMKAASMKADYMASLGADGRKQIINEESLDNSLRNQAIEEVLNEAIQQRVKEHKASEDYGVMEERAINSAGLAATNSFWPEAIKYGLVNTVGYRKYLFSNPTSVVQRASRNFKGIREITTSAGRKRLTTDVSKALTNADKWKEFGKVAGSQVWGGAWTNGTDDMMVDAAERINEDSFNRYLHDYETGESTADTYGFLDGIYSYMLGLQNSLGQETTLNAAIVGGLGSVISGNLHFTNIASLFTKEGKEAFKNNYQQRYKRDENGMLILGEDGKPIVEQVGWKKNLGDRLGFFIQNGVLNSYYGKKQELRNLQEHADYVNSLLDDYDDFQGIDNLISSNIGRENALNIGDEKTMRFVQAFNAIHALENLGKSEKDPTTLSSVVMQHKDMIEKASKLGTEDNEMTEEEINSLLGQYYSNNPGLPQTEENNQIALQNIAQNARKLQEAYQAYNKAEESIQGLERDMGSPIVPSVRFKMKMSQALDSHWRDRLQTMKDEIGDTSSDVPTEGETLIAAVGGKRKADKILKDFSIQENILLQGVSDAVSKQQKMLDEYNKAQQTLRNAEEKADSEAILQAQKDLKEAQDNYDESVEERMFREDMLDSAREKQQRLQDALSTWEKGDKSKVLTADEIMSLDPVTRAKMLRELEFNPLTGELESDPYNTAQRKQIEKLKARLKTQDKAGDPLQKIQDIALLTQRIAQNEDAYHRISRNPDAAALQLEKQQKEAAEKAVELINYRNANILTSYIYEMSDALVGRKDISKKQIEDYVYRTLRNKNSTLLNIIENENLIPIYYPQVQKAQEWTHITSDIDAVLSNMSKSDAEINAFRNSIDKIIEPATSKDEVISNLEREIDRAQDISTQQDYEELLNGLQHLGYQRDATVIENRKQRKEREEAQRKAEEERKQQVEAAIKEAEAKKAAEDAKKKTEEAVIKAQQTEQEHLMRGAEGVDLGDLGFEETFAKETAGTVTTSAQQIKRIEEIDVPTLTGEKRRIKAEPVGYSDLKSGDIVWYSGPASNTPISSVKVDGIDQGDVFGRSENKDIILPKGRTYYREVTTTQQSIERKDGDVTSEVSEKDGIKTTKFTQYRATKSGEVKSITDKGGLEIDASTISKDYLDDADQYEEIRLAELREGEGRMMGTIWTKDSEGTWTQFDVKFDSDPRETASSNKSNIDEIVDLWKIYASLGTQNIPKTLNDIGYQMTDIEEAEKLFKEKYPEGVPEITEEEADEIAKTFGIQQNLQSSVNTIMEVHDETLGDVIQSKSPSLEDQVAEAQREGQGEAQDVNSLADSVKENSMGEEAIEISPTILSGNAMSEYEPEALEEHRLVHKRGEKEGDSMNQFYEWMENAGIKLQNIIDDELPQILAQNPHVHVKFMRIRPDKNATHDDYMQNHLMLVIDYNSDVEELHQEGNGGVITSDGKKYLIVGTVGYGKAGKHSDKFNLWKMLMDNYAPNSHKLKVKSWNWFKQDVHKAERFYVHPDFYTEIVPNSMIPGYLIRQNETDEISQERSISELLDDKERNPHNYNLEDLGWGIQTESKFWATNTGGKMVMGPEHTIDNLGRAFVLVPAGNGKLIPAKIEPLHYADGMDESGKIVNPTALNRDSVLWKRIQDLLNQLTSPKYADRQAAIRQLPMLLYLVPKDKGNKTILIGTDEHDNRVTVVNGEQRTTFFLDSNFDREAFFKAVREMNPRINITPSALTNKDRLKELEEIGALKTDIAKLGTSGVSYSIYGIDADGNMIMPERTNSVFPEEPSGNLRNNIREFRYLYNANYKYNTVTGEFTKDGVPVTGDDMIGYAYKIGTQQVASVKQEGVWQYYIISTGDNPEVVRQNNVGRIERLSKDEAQKVINDEVERVAEERRMQALNQALSEAVNNTQESETILEEDGSLSFFEDSDTNEAEEGQTKNQPIVSSQLSVPSDPVEGSTVQNSTRSFKQLWRSKDRGVLLDVLTQKDWSDVPLEDMSALKEYLINKGMPNIDSIGTSEVDFNAWLRMLKCL